MKKVSAVAALLALAACTDAPTAPLTAVPHIQSAARDASTEPITNQYIVRFQDNEPDPALHAKQIERTHGAVVERVYTAAIKGAAMSLADDAAEALRSDHTVLSVEQDQVVSISTTQTGATWGIDRIDQRNLPLSGTYTYTPTGAGVTAYIIDTGILFTHQEFGGRASAGIDEVTSGGNAVDCNGHGTHVSGTVGGATYGVAKAVKLVAVRVLDCSGSGTVSGVMAGVDWVTQHATLPAVANMSLGGGFSATLNQAVTNSIAAGVVYSIAAGNSSADACTESPSSTPNAIVVGATAINDSWASFSNFGTCVKIDAPGVNITSAWIGTNPNNATTNTNTISGTSMATPHVTGASALYLQANPGSTPAQVRSALTSNATSGALSGVPANTPNLLLYTGFLNPTTTASFTSSCPSLTCSFDASGSTALPSATYSWTFGDGNSGTGKTTSHTYAAAGSYTVTLTVSDANGTATKSATVVVNGVNQPPVAHFTYTCVGQANPNQCAFDASTSTDDHGIVLYAWNWGNGHSESHTTPTTKNTFSPGVYTVTLTVSDAGNLTNSTSQQVTVGTVANQPPTANITSPTANASFVQGTSVSFAGTGTDPEDGTLTGASLTWSSSRDGAIGTGTSFSKTNLSVGTHVITLTATDSKGATGTATVTITVTAPNQPPTANISAPTANASFVQGASVSFAGTGTDPEDGTLTGASLTWSSSRDGAIGTGTSFSKTNLSVGTHVITLTATDSKGATGTATVTITITAPNQPPTANITSPTANQSFQQGTSVSFAGTGTDPEDGALSGASLVWTSSIDGQIGTGTSFSTSALSVGTHTITLTATDSKGATGTATVSITITTTPPVNQPPVAAFTWTCVGQPNPHQCFFDGSTSTDDHGVVTWSWAWGNGRSESHPAPTSRNTFATAGSYQVTLTVTDGGGLTSSVTHTVAVP